MICLNWLLLPKIEVFYRPEWTKWGTTWKWILTCFKYKSECYKQRGKSRWKKEVVCLVPMFCSWVRKLSRKVYFLQLCAGLSKNLGLLNQCTYMHLKVLITHFQKMVWFTGIWATVHEVLVIKISKNMLTQQKFNKILQIQILIFLKH